MDGKSYPQRKSPRLKGYDYTQEGAYFVTICTHQRLHHFGEVINSTMNLNDAGHFAESCWHEIPQHFPEVELDACIVMPNHIHGIVIIQRTQYIASLQSQTMHKTAKLGTIIATYKAAVSRQIHQLPNSNDDLIWQERYHDHIIRNEESFNHIRNYVIHNPSLWQEDTFYS